MSQRFDNASPIRNQNRIVLGTYDTANNGYNYSLKLASPSFSRQSVTFSTSTFGYSKDIIFTPKASNLNDDYRPALYEIDEVLTNIDQGFISHMGNDTAFDRDYIFYPPRDMAITAIQFHLAIGLNVSAYTSGNFRIDEVVCNLASFQGTSSQAPFSPQGQGVHFYPQTTFTALTGTGTQIMICEGTYSIPMQGFSGQPVNLDLNVNETTGTGTRQIGLVNWFPYSANAGYRSIYRSEIKLHCQSLASSPSDIVPFSKDYAVSGVTSL